jgi:hypothetical protein
MILFDQLIKRFTISIICIVLSSCKIVKKQEPQMNRRGVTETTFVCMIPDAKSRYYYLDSTNAIYAYRDTNRVERFDTIKVENTPVQQRRNWLNDSVRYLPVINGFDRLDTIRHNNR